MATTIKWCLWTYWYGGYWTVCAQSSHFITESPYFRASRAKECRSRITKQRPRVTPDDARTINKYVAGPGLNGIVRFASPT